MEYPSFSRRPQNLNGALPLGIHHASTSDGTANPLLSQPSSAPVGLAPDGLSHHGFAAYNPRLSQHLAHPQQVMGGLRNIQPPDAPSQRQHQLHMLHRPSVGAAINSAHGNEHPMQFHKLCSKCKASKPSEDFFKDRSKPDGLYSQCKVCSATEEKRRRESRASNSKPIGVTKTCTRCKVVKAMGDFCQNKRSSDGLYSQCRSCVADKDRERRTKTLATKADVVPEKTCSRCGQTKPSDEFYKDSSKHDGLQTYCKPCLCQKHKELRVKRNANKEKPKKAKGAGDTTDDVGTSPLYQHPQDLGGFDLTYFGDPQLINHPAMAHEIPNHMQHMPAGELSMPVNAHRFMQSFTAMSGVSHHDQMQLDLSMERQRADEKAQQAHPQLLNGDSMQHAITSMLGHAALQRSEKGLGASPGLGLDPRQGVDHLRGAPSHQPQEQPHGGQAQPSCQPPRGSVRGVGGTVSPDNNQAVQQDRALQADEQTSLLSSVGVAGVSQLLVDASTKMVTPAERARQSSRMQQESDAAQLSVARQGGSRISIRQTPVSRLLSKSAQISCVDGPPTNQADGLVEGSLLSRDPRRSSGNGSGADPARSGTEGLSAGLLLQNPSEVGPHENPS